MDEVLYRLIVAASCSQALVLIGNLNCPDIFWRNNRAKHKLSRRFLKCIDDNFIFQFIEKPVKRRALLDLILTSKEGLTGAVKVKGSLACSDYEMLECRTLRAERRTCNKLKYLISSLP